MWVLAVDLPVIEPDAPLVLEVRDGVADDVPGGSGCAGFGGFWKLLLLALIFTVSCPASIPSAASGPSFSKSGCFLKMSWNSSC